VPSIEKPNLAFREQSRASISLILKPLHNTCKQTFLPFSWFDLMTGTKALNASKKRKVAEEDNVQGRDPPDVNGNLEMLSEDEEDEKENYSESDDGEADEFPEIDAASDSEEEEEEDNEEEEDDDEDENEEVEEEEDSLDEDDLGIFPKAKTIVSDITGQQKKVYPDIEPDYDSDSSTEDVRCTLFNLSFPTLILFFSFQDPNRVGNIPMHWYDDLPHVGYDLNGKKVLRPVRGDELDKFLKTVEDPSAWCVTYHVILSCH
jgi:ribosome biogenesis protein ERB1